MEEIPIPSHFPGWQIGIPMTVIQDPNKPRIGSEFITPQMGQVQNL